MEGVLSRCLEAGAEQSGRASREKRFCPPLTNSKLEDWIGGGGLLFRSRRAGLQPSHEVLLPPAGSFREHKHLVNSSGPFSSPLITLSHLIPPPISFIQKHAYESTSYVWADRNWYLKSIWKLMKIGKQTMSQHAQETKQ